MHPDTMHYVQLACLVGLLGLCFYSAYRDITRRP